MILPSIIAKTQEELNAAITTAKEVSTTVQFDIMDGKFVKNHSLDFKLDIPPGLTIEAHLMVEDPISFFMVCPSCFDTIIFHLEAVPEPAVVIDMIKGTGAKVGIAINPDTSIEDLYPLVEKIDMALIMTVIPGKYGAPFVPDALAKVRRLHFKYPDLPVEVDGSMNMETIGEAAKSGATRFVVGSALMQSMDIQKTYKELTEVITNARS